jgi:glutamate--cysteine ligase
MANSPAPPPDQTISNTSELLDYFHSGCTAPEEWGVGLEYERVGVRRATGEAIPFSGDNGVEATLEGISREFGWERQEENGRLIALKCGTSGITLEPGGQMELSGSIHGDLCSMRQELARHLGNSLKISEPLEIAWLPVGLQPITEIKNIEWVPKGRYGIMGSYLGARGDLAHHMMKGTAGVQMNYDYSSEQDATDKLRTAMGITTILTAACANSPLYAGKKTGFMSRRAHIWTDTDPERCGLLEFALNENSSFRSYMEYALDVPLQFIQRNEQWIDLKGLPFRKFLADGAEGERATFEDWTLQLTTIFTEVRLKTYVETRGADSVPPDLVMAVAAFWKGILYDDDARAGAWAMVKGVPFAERVQFHDDVAIHGPAARLGGRPASEMATELVGLAKAGLGRIGGSIIAGPCEVVQEMKLLEPLEESLATPGSCPASDILRLFEESGGDVAPALINKALVDDRAFNAHAESASR